MLPLRCKGMYLPRPMKSSCFSDPCSLFFCFLVLTPLIAFLSNRRLNPIICSSIPRMVMAVLSN